MGRLGRVSISKLTLFCQSSRRSSVAELVLEGVFTLELLPDEVDEVEEDGVEPPDGLLLEELPDEVVDEPPVEGELEVLPPEVLPLEVLLLEVLLLELPLLEVPDGAELLLSFFEELLSGSVTGLLGVLLEIPSEDGLPETLPPAILLVEGVSVGLPSDGFF